MYNRILLAVDGSDHSERAANEALKLVKLNPNAIVSILYVVDYSKSRADIMNSVSNEQVHATRRKLLVGVEKIFEENDVNTEVIFLHGEPGPTIVQHANKERYDILVVGSRGLNTLQEMVLGSVSHKVAKRVQMPVLIVK